MNRGYTILELVVVIAVIGVIVSYILFRNPVNEGAERTLRWVSDVKYALNRYIMDRETLPTGDWLQELVRNSYIIIPSFVQGLGPVGVNNSTSQSFNCDDGKPSSSVMALYLLRMNCKENNFCQTLKSRLQSEGYCLQLSGSEITLVIR